MALGYHVPDSRGCLAGGGAGAAGSGAARRGAAALAAGQDAGGERAGAADRPGLGVRSIMMHCAGRGERGAGRRCCGEGVARVLSGCGAEVRAVHRSWTRSRSGARFWRRCGPRGGRRRTRGRSRGRSRSGWRSCAGWASPAERRCGEGRRQQGGPARGRPGRPPLLCAQMWNSSQLVPGQHRRLAVSRPGVVNPHRAGQARCMPSVERKCSD
mmetsp:Transcript_42825/g.108306  ORF Transcript_42825/g.108306 Transcript_42825/m.108306 type:complete len:213 (-) Transcript_42825:35-673(-)